MRPKAGGGEIVMLPQRSGQEGYFVDSLVKILSLARQGNVRSYAAVFRVEAPDGQMHWTTSWSKTSNEEGGDYYMLIGGLTQLLDRVVEASRDEWRSV